MINRTTLASVVAVLATGFVFNTVPTTARSSGLGCVGCTIANPVRVPTVIVLPSAGLPQVDAPRQQPRPRRNYYYY